MKSVVCQELLMPQGSHFSCFVKISNQKKATPTFALIRDLERKRRAVRNSLRSNSGPLHPRFHSKSRGRMDGAPVDQKISTRKFKLRLLEREKSPRLGFPFLDHVKRLFHWHGEHILFAHVALNYLTPTK